MNNATISDRISLQKAQELIQKNIAPLPAAEMTIEKALGCILARDVIATMDHPPFPRSPYDGYALHSEDSIYATSTNPVSLKLVGESAAGNPASMVILPGQAVRIMTGAAIPDGADCVVPQEAVEITNDMIHITTVLAPFDNYCHKGEDFKKGSVLVKSGAIVTSAVAAVAVSTGCVSLSCIPIPKCAALSTGNELQVAGRPLSSGEIYDSNRTFIMARLRELGLSVLYSDYVADKTENICSKIIEGLDSSDVLITTGGVSVGSYDLVPHALRKLKARVLFHGIAIKPGMPTLFAVLKGKPVVSLSGNPFAMLVGFEMVARFVIAALTKNRKFEPKTELATLQNTYNKQNKTARYLCARVENGCLLLTEKQSNGQLRTLTECNCLAEVPPRSGNLLVGASLRVYLF